MPDNVIGPAAQGIAAGEFAELVRAIRAGATYVNVHTTVHPGGEIRKQLRGRRATEETAVAGPARAGPAGGGRRLRRAVSARRRPRSPHAPKKTTSSSATP